MEAEQRRSVGRPRSEDARRAILAGALELASEHGTEGLTMEGIAKRAGVSKETLYRWWRSKADVLLDALTDLGERAIPVPDSGTLSGDLRAFTRATARALDPSTRQLLRTLAAAAAADGAVAEQVREKFLRHRRAALATVLDRAAHRHELSDQQISTVLDLVFGSLWYRLIFVTGPLDRAWADAVADAITTMARD